MNEHQRTRETFKSKMSGIVIAINETITNDCMDKEAFQVISEHIFNLIKEIDNTQKTFKNFWYLKKMKKELQICFIKILQEYKQYLQNKGEK